MKSKDFTRRALLRSMAMFGIAAGSGRALAASKTYRFSTVKRSFDDPYLELIRLLKEGSEIE